MPLSPPIRVLATSLAVLLAACSPGSASEEAEAKPRVGLFSTLPIYWGEGDIAAVLDGEDEKDWVREELESRFDLVPLDTLEPEALAGLDRVVLAQPRALAPSENVSFDQWLAEGGRAVILADPMLTRHSRYSLGDRRRPQDVVLLSPILAHWGLELRFDEDQPAGERSADIDGTPIPINLAGHLAAQDGGGQGRACTVRDSGLIARCDIGNGTAVVLADAALLDWEGARPAPVGRKAALWSLLRPLTAGDTPRD